ncbi:hypothetical protein AMS68_006244 [Peltaster fructicola]|uniref:BZIP domain-containing protein n=1 Tax=Peltaster fructicola TaxID=286661 RepID=A0A6H0Y140_9PEZI|nr:hypothetical protein AMS68_006244 [Peltaster fructicola]
MDPCSKKRHASTGHREAKSAPRTADEERARLRRNQQNSRARKRTYVGDLERRWADCVASGAQASTELQQEARRVLLENKRLRTMLHELGIDNTTIQRRLAWHASSDQLPDTSGLASPALNSMTCRRPDAAAQMNTSNDTDAILEEHIHSSIADDWTGTATGEIGTVLSEWDVAHWLQDLTDLKDEFGSQEQHEVGPGFVNMAQVENGSLSAASKTAIIPTSSD